MNYGQIITKEIFMEFLKNLELPQIMIMSLPAVVVLKQFRKRKNKNIFVG